MEKVSDCEAQGKLLDELKYLRVTLKEIGEAFILRSEGEIETIAGYLTGMSPKNTRQIAKVWLKEARGTNFKPTKGRFKDLKKIDHLLEDLLHLIIEYQTIPDKQPVKRKQPVKNIRSAPKVTES
jgi:hypothetical protein